MYSKYKALYNKRLAIGLCARCGNRHAVEGLSMCDTCRDKVSIACRDYRRRMRAMMALMRVCIHCFNVPSEVDSNACCDCRSKRSARVKLRADNGFCAECSMPAVHGTTRCEMHRSMDAAYAITRYRAKKKSEKQQ